MKTTTRGFADKVARHAWETDGRSDSTQMTEVDFEMFRDSSRSVLAALDGLGFKVVPKDKETPTIIERIEAQGVTLDRLGRALDGRDNWGEMVHSFEYLTVLSAVRDTWTARS